MVEARCGAGPPRVLRTRVLREGVHDVDPSLRVRDVAGGAGDTDAAP